MASSFTWSTRREGNTGFVLETHPDGSTVEFGPMPCEVVMKFLAGRRTLVSHMMRSKDFRLINEPVPDWKFMQ